MASIGLKGFWFGDYAEGSSKITVTDGKKVAKACNAEVTYQKASTNLYADNGKDDEVNVVTGISLSITPNDTNEDAMQEIMGLVKKSVSINEQTNEMYVMGSDTSSQFRSMAFIERVRISGVEKHKVYFFSKTKWYVPDNKTAQSLQESISFNTDTVIGAAFADINGNYQYTDLYDTEEKAIEAIEKLFGISKE